MTIREENRNLFTVPQGYYLAHCITADFSLGAGVAKKVDEVYNMREKLMHDYNNLFDEENACYVGEAICVDNVFNLVLKKNPIKKAKYKRLRNCLKDMRDIMEENLITKVAMPKIGCGHKGLDWERVREIIEEVFEDTNIEILVCTL